MEMTDYEIGMVEVRNDAGSYGGTSWCFAVEARLGPFG
jgi:hypothetical protein